MAEEPVWTHQLPRVGREIEKAMLERRPELAEAVAEAEEINRDNHAEYAARWVARYGKTMTVERLSSAQHTSKGPVDELLEMKPGANVIVMETAR